MATNDVRGGKTVARGISLNVGLNSVDPSHYQGWTGDLRGCEYDAGDMAHVASGRGFEVEKLLTADATANALISAVERAAERLADGDTLLLTYSGHGGQVPDLNGDEEDRMDETWVLYDRELVDDELYALWARLQPGVRVAVFSDSCHSGTVARAVRAAVGAEAIARAVGGGGDEPPALKGMPDDVARDVYEHHKELYDEIQRAVPSFDRAEILASVILTSGCQDNQTSADGSRNGLFTQTLLAVWDAGKFKGGYRTFRNGIARRMPPWQSPNLFTVGTPDNAFVRQCPFTI
jgi:hypothetical protein